MGYTHYYETVPEFDKEKFALVAKDFEKLVAPLEHLGVKLAGGLGAGEPEITRTEIRFNGLERCGHSEKNLGIAWPSDNASGVASGHAENQHVAGKWHFGLEIETRTCDGDCSHETFSLEQKRTPRGEWDKPRKTKRDAEMYFAFTKTAYKPYDLAVTACLIIAKHHLKDDILVSSDGNIDKWKDAMMLCGHFLGYGGGFQLD